MKIGECLKTFNACIAFFFISLSMPAHAIFILNFDSSANS